MQILRLIAVKQWRCVLFTLYFVWLSGCAAIPPVVDYASWALSGIAYVSTGKGPSDHAISYVAKKDCSLLRLLLFKPVCIPVTEDTNKSLLARIMDFFKKEKSEEKNVEDEQLAFNDSEDFRKLSYGPRKISRR